MKPWILLVACLSVFATASDDAQAVGPETFRHQLSQRMADVPPEWLGIWFVTSTAKDCETGFVFFSNAEPDTLCANSALDPEDDEVGLSCTSTLNATNYSSTCTGTVEEAGCTATYTYESNFTRTGDAYSGVTTLTLDYQGVDCGPAVCMRIETSATRVSSSTSSCLTPVEPTTWGTVKSLYED